MNIRHVPLSIVLIVALISGCASMRDKQLPPLNGMIYDADNKPVSNVRIETDGSYAATSDIQGHFVLSQVKTGKEMAIFASKQGYEPAELAFTYTNATQVLYIRMISGEQLTNEAERKVQEKNWSDARDLLDRADAAAGDFVKTGYLRAIILVETGKTTDAVALLESIRISGVDEPYIDLFLADIYQYRLSDMEKSREALTRYLAAKSDEDNQKRLDDLK